ncbi:MAG: hypothetical protein V4507_14875 [Verrucomicrobiota bacterium]
MKSFVKTGETISTEFKQKLASEVNGLAFEIVLKASRDTLDLSVIKELNRTDME